MLGLGTAAAPAVMAEWFPGLCESGPVVLSLVGVPMQDLGSLPSLGLSTAAAPVVMAEWFPGFCESGVVLVLLGVLEGLVGLWLWFWCGW